MNFLSVFTLSGSLNVRTISLPTGTAASLETAGEEDTGMSSEKYTTTDRQPVGIHQSDQASSAYQARGVSATKDDVHQAVAGQDKGLFPGAFCKVLAAPAGTPDWCAALHADGAGTKASVAYLMYRESGDPSWFAGLAQDALVMNTDDLLSVGAP